MSLMSSPDYQCLHGLIHFCFVDTKANLYVLLKFPNTSDMTLLTLTHTVLFLFRYMKDNIASSQTYGRLYKDHVPDFLHDRPISFVRHCIDKMDLAQLIERDEIELQENSFKVK